MKFPSRVIIRLFPAGVFAAACFIFSIAAEAQVPGVPDDIDKRDRARPALRRIHPVAAPRIFCEVAVAAVPDVEAV